MKKNYFIFGYLLLLSLLFIMISFLLWLTGGKNSRLLGQKLRFGALIISLTAAASCSGPPGGEVTCYKQVPDNSFRVISSREDSGRYIIQGKKDSKITIHLYQRTGEDFSYSILDEERKIMQTGKLLPVDGKFDSSKEDFEIVLEKDLKEGYYKLQFFDLSKSNQDEEAPKAIFDLVVKSEPEIINSEIISPRRVHMCYKPTTRRTPDFYLSKEDNSIRELEFKKEEKKIINGEIKTAGVEYFSYRLEDSKNIVIQKGDIFPKDGKWDGEKEEYMIELPEKIKPGQYYIYFYELKEEYQDKDISHFLTYYSIKIKNLE
ncbi:MAG: hypothetical protein PHV06_04000 [bacterium]|nr:hypothetical protein [bacterium]